MKKKKNLLKLAAVIFFVAIVFTTATVDAQQVRYKMTTDIPASITTPDSVKTSLGTLKFFDGFPDEATVQKVYDNLDFQRGVQAFLTSLPAAVFYATRAGIRTFGPDNQTTLISESLLDSRTLIFVPNTETIYIITWFDTKDGPLVIEMPPNVLGFINDFWSRFVTDVGNPGPDKVHGGKYLLLPPGYAGAVPEGYFVLNSRTYGNVLFCRGFIVNGDLRPAVENARRNLRVYPLANAANPPAMNFVNISGLSYNAIPSNNVSFCEKMTQIREEPPEAIDPEVRDLFSVFGILKGMLFEPDARIH